MSLEDDWDNIDIDRQNLSKDDWSDIFNHLKIKIKKRHVHRLITKYVSFFCLLILLSCIVTYFILPNKNNKNGSFIVFENKTREIKQYKLSDGSFVQLDAGSKCYITSTYNINSRKIYIRGSGFFNVAKDKHKPFIVYTDHLSTKAIGTSFKVVNKKMNGTESILLTEGIVQVQVFNAQEKRILAVSDSLIYSPLENRVNVVHLSEKNKQFSKKTFSKKYSYPHSLSHSRMVKPQWYSFDNANLEDIFETLERMYQVKIQVDPSITSNKHFIGKFSYTDSLPHILKVITSLNSLELNQLSNKQYKITQKR